LFGGERKRTLLVVTEEEAGEYEVEYTFGEAGLYQYKEHVEIASEDSDFHIQVLQSIDDSEIDDGNDHGGNGHGH
jgi:hypothetical protein